MRWVWPVFGVCVAGVVAALAWVSVVAMRLDRAEAEARAQAALEEAARLALWRMDFYVASILAQENARPYFHYSGYYPLNRAYGNMFEGLESSNTLVESPLRSTGPEYASLYFQVDPDGRVTSPSVPLTAVVQLAASEGSGQAPVKCESAEKLASLRVQSLAARLPPLPGPRMQQQQLDAAPQVATIDGLDGGALPAPQQETSPQQQQVGEYAQGRDPPPQYAGKGQRARNLSELEARQRGVQQSSEQVLMNSVNPGDAVADVRHGPLTPLWLDTNLLLARRVQVKDAYYVQGMLLDWNALRTALLTEVKDLLPQAALEAVPAPEADPRDRRLAALPVRLSPGTVPAPREEGITPVRAALLLTWVCGVFATIAVGLLLHGATTLADRRAAFVSAVTHELRTPLTTFRLYSDLLAGGMVADEAKRANYLRTLQTEAQRLTHLVENVLAYARLERGRGPKDAEPIAVRELIARVCERLPDRAAQANLKLEVEVEPAAAGRFVRADPSAVEQVLFNLVDNACKYAHGCEPPRISIRAAAPRNGRSAIELRVRDFGPGLHNGRMSDLFQPFRKSAAQAARSAPGVGLGLALSRRIARGMGGELWLDSTVRPGACFVLRLPASPADA